MAWVLTNKQYHDIIAGDIVMLAYRGSYPDGRIKVIALTEDASRWLPEIDVLATVEHIEKIGSGTVRHHYRHHILFQRFDP